MSVSDAMDKAKQLSVSTDRYGAFHIYRILTKRAKRPRNVVTETYSNCGPPKAESTWLRLIMMFWNPRVMKTALRFGIAAVVMNQYEKLGFAVFLLCFAV